jgi:hypothetical protein
MPAEVTELTWRFGAITIPVEVQREAGMWMLKAVGRRGDLIVQDMSFPNGVARLRKMIEVKLEARKGGLA